MRILRKIVWNNTSHGTAKWVYAERAWNLVPHSCAGILPRVRAWYGSQTNCSRPRNCASDTILPKKLEVTSPQYLILHGSVLVQQVAVQSHTDTATCLLLAGGMKKVPHMLVPHRSSFKVVSNTQIGLHEHRYQFRRTATIRHRGSVYQSLGPELFHSTRSVLTPCRQLAEFMQ